MTEIQLTEDQPMLEMILSGLDTNVSKFIKSSRGMSTDDFLEEAMNLLRSAGFAVTDPQSLGDKTALVGTNSKFYAKVQLVWNAEHFVEYARFNGQSYGNQQPVWDTSKLKPDQEPRMLINSYYYRGPIHASKIDTYRRTVRSH